MNFESRYQDGAYLEATGDWHEEDAAWKAAHIRDMIEAVGLKAASVCDVGCGTGGVLAQLQAMHEVSLAELAASVNLSPFHFARAFKRSTGLPPHRFQQRLRMESARELLRTTQLSVTDIALRVGYGSSQALARAFRRDAGATPAEFRHSASAR